MAFKKGDFVEHSWLGNGVYKAESRYEGDAYVKFKDGKEILVSEYNLKHRNPTFTEWKEKHHPPKCKCCDKLLEFRFDSFAKGEINRVRDVDGTKVKGLYCKDCYIESQAYLMNERFVENYNGEIIFCKDDMYSPYWECPYHFKTIEECRTRMDANHIAVMPWGLIQSRVLINE